MKAAQRVSTPLIATRTFDPASAIYEMLATLGSQTESTPAIHWDVMQGLKHLNEAGRKSLAQMLNGRDPETIGPTDALSLTYRLIGSAYSPATFTAVCEVLQGVRLGEIDDVPISVGSVQRAAADALHLLHRLVDCKTGGPLSRRKILEGFQELLRE